MIPAEIALVSGRTLEVQLESFSVRNVQLHLKGGAAPIAVDRVAFIAFLRDNAATPAPDDAHVGHFRLHLAGGHMLIVRMRTVDAEGANLGFYTWPIDPDSPFRARFVYRAALQAIEEDSLTGDLLIAAGEVTEADVDAALQSQQVRIGTILHESEGIPEDLLEAAAELQKKTKSRIGELLVEAGLATPAQIASALAEQARRRDRKIGEILVEQGALSEGTLVELLGRKFKLPVVDLSNYAIDPAAARAIPREVIERYGVLPIGLDGRRVIVAIADPLVRDLHNILGFTLRSKRFAVVLAPPSQLRRHVADWLRTPEEAPPPRTPAPIDVEVIHIETGEPEVEHETIGLANQIIIDGIKAGASDIHIEPNGDEGKLLVRFRVDGDCRTHLELPPTVRATLTARLKILANLDISERRKPQDGKIRFRLPDRWVELRVATIPTVGGNEDVVMRILAGSTPLPIDKAGLSALNLYNLRQIIAQPYGLFLCVGPTGSGKTTTLHSVLSALNTPDTKIWTAEDPVEITQVRLRQVQIQSKVGLDFAKVLRAFLRADPDVIMVGEMRDKETASIGVEASLTGHLVLSTLHTNGAPETVARLLDMGLDPFNFADALLGVLAQRLARRLCKECKRKTPLSQSDYDQVGGRYGVKEWEALVGPWTSAQTIWTAVGCPKCGGTGYKGRVALHELMALDDDLKPFIQHRKPVAELRLAAAAKGMHSLVQDGIEKILAGDTDLAQVLSVCSK